MSHLSPAPVGFVAPTDRAEWFDYSEHTGVRQLAEHEMLDLLESFDYSSKEARQILTDLLDTGVAVQVVPNVFELTQEEDYPSSAALTPMFPSC